ncbi:MAG: hypothetical protein ABR909_04945 [Candidatus Bathyarchaeia archaeon]|jgi:hypothetical protein
MTKKQEYSENQRNKVLLALFEKDFMIFRELTSVIRSRNKTRKILDDYGDQKPGAQMWIHEERHKNYKQKGKLEFSLTVKGREKTRELVLKDVNQCIVVLKDVMALDKIDPSELVKWRIAYENAWLNVKINNEMSEEEIDQKFRAVNSDYYSLLFKAYRVLHDLVCQFTIPEVTRTYPGYLGITEKGSLHFIPTAILKKDGYIPPNV